MTPTEKLAPPESIMRQFIERQFEKLPTIEGNGGWRSGYMEALKNMAIVLDAIPVRASSTPSEEQIRRAICCPHGCIRQDDCYSRKSQYVDRQVVEAILALYPQSTIEPTNTMAVSNARELAAAVEATVVRSDDSPSNHGKTLVCIRVDAKKLSFIGLNSAMDAILELVLAAPAQTSGGRP